MKYLFTIVGAMALTIGCVGCGCRSQKQARQNTEAATEYKFHMPQIPPALQGDVAREYLREHLWDGFDFQDTLQLEQLDARMMTQVFAYYVATVDDTHVEGPMKEMMRRAATSKPMLRYFMGLAERVLHDPNSPARDDEKYIPVLEYVLESPLMNEYEKMPYANDLHVAMQNRVGYKANDIHYITADGHKGRMQELKADFTLIFISNPGCPMCKEIKQQIEQSALLCNMIGGGRLKVLVIYPDEDIAEWRAHLEDYPKQWINAYDEGQQMTLTQSYDLRAIPALYLLDDRKCVLVKDCTDVGYIEKMVSDRLGL